MSAYKVMFNNTEAVSAEPVSLADCKDMKQLQVHEDGRHVMDWFIVEADTHATALEVAPKVVRQIWGKMLEWE